MDANTIETKWRMCLDLGWWISHCGLMRCVLRRVQVQDAYRAAEEAVWLLGVTAVEDQLQDLVPETITTLRRAGIKVGTFLYFIFNFCFLLVIIDLSVY
jgi:hypothetical protein